MHVDINKPRIKAYGLVRDSNGKPRVDGDPRDLHPTIKEMMTKEEYILAIKEYENGLA